MKPFSTKNEIDDNTIKDTRKSFQNKEKEKETIKETIIIDIRNFFMQEDYY